MAELDREQTALLERVMERLLLRGYTWTPQRRKVAEELLGSRRALTARELSERLALGGRRVGVMTVYRTLEKLAEVGAVYALYDRFREGSEAHYVFCSDRHHHHLVCSRCWAVVEVEAEGCTLAEGAEAELGANEGFLVQGHSVDFHGLCPDCRRTGGPAEMRPS